MTIRLQTLTVENFRSLKGEIVVPLDAPVVLLHGANGMGKTSILSALELALTGDVGHLHRAGDNYRQHLLHKDTQAGMLSLTAIGDELDGGKAEARFKLDAAGFTGTPLLTGEAARFFTERCYLPQATLGRLLEIYEASSPTDKTSPLTRFVKDLLGLDQLDAIIDGFNAAFHVARIRNLVPSYRRFEGLQTDLQQQVQRAKARKSEAEAQAATRRAALGEALRLLYGEEADVEGLLSNHRKLLEQLEGDRAEDDLLIELRRAGTELGSLLARWQDLPSELSDSDRTAKEAEERAIRAELAKWDVDDGARLSAAVLGLADLFPDLPSPSDDPELARSVAEQRAVVERNRCQTLLAQSQAATNRLAALDAVIARASARLAELSDQLERPARDAQALAKALAGVVPHLEGEVCPVCDRNFTETGDASLATHIAAKIATLSGEAGKLQELAQQRAEASTQVGQAQRERLTAQTGLLSPADFANLTIRRARLDDAIETLASLTASAHNGSLLRQRHSAAKEALAGAGRRAEQVDELRSDTTRWVQGVTGGSLDDYAGIEEAIEAALDQIQEDTAAADAKRRARVTAAAELNLYTQQLEEAARQSAAIEALDERLARIKSATHEVDTAREQAKAIANAAEASRTNIVGRVFNTSLNKVWRDLFVRLAPAEQFVPAFQLPEARGKVEARLDTERRGGGRGGPPGAMLSQGNLTTAALTLFLALHLSVTERLPWLILDDPVQSMDDVHVSQFAALVRTLSKTLGRQVIIAVHEKALFDYLTLELSPAYQDDGLITVELSRTMAGDTLATPTAYTFKPDKAIAA